MKGIKVTAEDVKRNMKRLNLCLPIRTIEEIILVAEYNRISAYAMVASWVSKMAANEASNVRKTKYVPIAARGINLFDENGFSFGAKKTGRRK